jgi:hypothetical protein
MSIGRVDLLVTMVLLLHGELVELTGDVIGGTGIAVPVGVHTIRRRVGALLLLFFFVVGVAVPALPGTMPGLATDLTGDDVAFFSATLATATKTRVAVATTAASMPAVAIATASTATTILAASAWSSSAT